MVVRVETFHIILIPIITVFGRIGVQLTGFSEEKHFVFQSVDRGSSRIYKLLDFKFFGVAFGQGHRNSIEDKWAAERRRSRW